MLTFTDVALKFKQKKKYNSSNGVQTTTKQSQEQRHGLYVDQNQLEFH